MADMIIVVSRWLHLLAAVIWIGGMASILFVVLPSGRKALAGGTAGLMGEVSVRFAPIANISIGLLVLTGLALIFAAQEPEPDGNRMRTWSLGLKLLLALLMFLVHFYRNLLLAPKIAGAATETSRASLQKLSLNLARMNFWIAMLILLISAALDAV